MENNQYALQQNKWKNEQGDISLFTIEQAQRVLAYHRSFPQYEQTPLRKLAGLAEHLGIGGCYVKDEAFRFGLNAFKVLGGSYAIGRELADRIGIPQEELSYEKLMSPETREKMGQLTFVTATDGNHGRGVAWTAAELGQKAIVYMPKGSAKERLENIRALGAEASITDLNYDDAVRKADAKAQEIGGIMVQDTAWEGYEDIPTWIMQGYMTMAYEAYMQLEGVVPTHIFIQAGVGSLAAAVQGFFANAFPNHRPKVYVVEPQAAACIYLSGCGQGERRIVTGDMQTIMAGLACGEPNTIGWEVLKSYAGGFLSCPERTAAVGMRVLGNPMAGDERIISGESGAPGVGLLYEAMTNEKLKELREQLGLGSDSVVLCFSTEGDTDRENYRRIVWEGAYSQ